MTTPIDIEGLLAFHRANFGEAKMLAEPPSVDKVRAARETARDERAAVADEMQVIIDAAETRGGNLQATEQRKYDVLASRHTQLGKDIDTATARIEELLVEAETRANDAGGARQFVPRAVVTREDAIYRPGAGKDKPSVIQDLFWARSGDSAATERLSRNKAAVDADYEKRTGVTTVTGAGGEFAPPLWAIDEYVALARAARPTADLCTSADLPGGVSSINLPSITVGTTVAAQTTQNTAVSNTTPTTSSVTDTVHTVAGFVQISQQELDQSPINMDEVLLSDLTMAYAAVLDTAVVTAIVAGGATGSAGVTYTQASPTTLLTLPKIANAVVNVNTTRFLPGTAIVMTPARWGLLLAAQTSAGGAFFSNLQNFNAFGEGTDVQAQGIVGTLFGLPVVVDPNVPTNLGAGTNQDEVIVARFTDNVLYESSPKLDIQPGQFASSLSLVVRFWRYYSFLARYPKAISVISGTGLIPYSYGS